MSSQDSLEWKWHSQQGTSRTENRDAGGVFFGNAYTLGIVMDASSKGHRGISFNATWIANIFERLPTELASPVHVVDAMREAQKQLREGRFLQERACYAALLLLHHSETAFAFVCGDCSIGHYQNDHSTTWLTRTHTLADICNLDDSKRNIVTRTLSAKRFESPEISQIDFPPPSGVWVLATDGHRSRTDVRDEDDASKLLLGASFKPDTTPSTGNLTIAGPRSRTKT